MKAEMSFDRIVGLADGLSLLQKESLVEILSSRLVEQKRAVLRKEILDANREFRAGKCRAISATDLMREITR